tara:strand:+ start:368 stop:1123 length:756 start_codon:yes stop_codon:yes gene_type:complete
MVFGGDLGRVFGFGTTKEVVTPIATAFTRNPFAGAAIGQLAQGAADKLSSGAQAQAADVSSPPAGVDSPATTFNISQTSGLGGLRDTRDGTMGRVNQGFIGGFGVPGLIGQAGRLLSRPGVGGALTGLGAGFAFDTITDMFGNRKKFVITRKLQREVKKVFMMSGGDIGFVAQNSMMLFGKDLNEDQILQVLFKTFKNQGPFVTKAAVRKTRSTIRKMETLCDLKDRLCPPKRATPRRRSAPSTTKVLQVK